MKKVFITKEKRNGSGHRHAAEFVGSNFRHW